MSEELCIHGQTIQKENFSGQKLGRTEYESCTFIACDFSNADLSKQKFISCNFDQCNFTMTKVVGTHFQEAKFTSSKLLGVLFEKANPFLLEMKFENCLLDHSSFCNLKLKKLHFVGCRMHGTDFTNADIPETLFAQSDLLDAVFDNTNLEKSDFRSAFNFHFDPENNRLKAARFSVAGLPGLLAKHKILIE